MPSTEPRSDTGVAHRVVPGTFGWVVEFHDPDGTEIHPWPSTVGPWWVEPVDYHIGSPMTAGLFRVRGYVTDGGHTVPFSLFLKVIQSFRHWPLLHVLPPALREDATWLHPLVSAAGDPRLRADLAELLPSEPGSPDTLVDLGLSLPGTS